MEKKKSISINDWLDNQLAKGSYGFSKDSLLHEISDYTEVAAKRALSRLTKNGRVVSLYKGYYLIIPPQYRSRGILPPAMYMDALMKHLQRPYYMALLNAGAFHGAAHQQPQEYFVVTEFPVLRPTKKNGLKVNYISIKEVPKNLVDQRKTEAGYINISNVALTACDLVQFEKRIGGLNRAAAVLNELVEAMNPTDFIPTLLRHVHVTTLQRLGFLMETVCMNQMLADALYDTMVHENLNFYRIPLKASKSAKGYSSNNRWNVIINTEIEIDE
jgi:predicted transcriptional regulator of viral defense system